jgi:hypothetical protein
MFVGRKLRTNINLYGVYIKGICEKKEVCILTKVIFPPLRSQPKQDNNKF